MMFFNNIMQHFSFYPHLSLCIHFNLVIMKPLILSFFLVILAYSLFFDKEKDNKEISPSTINTRSTNINSTDTTMNADSIIFYANKSVDPFELNF